MRADQCIKLRSAEILGQGLGPCRDAKAFQKDALRGQSAVFALCNGGRTGDRFEIDMCGQVGAAGFVQRINRGMGLQGLQRVPKRAPVTIVDHQSRAAVARDSRGDVLDNARRGLTQLDQIAVLCVVKTMVQRGLRCGGSQPEHQIPRVGGANHPLGPARARAHKLPDR